MMETFSATPYSDAVLWGEHHVGHEAFRRHHERLFAAASDIIIDVRRHVAQEAILFECQIKGSHEGPWRGLPPTGGRIAFPICVVYGFDDGDKLAGERIYHDRATVLNQLGVMHEPASPLGRVMTALTHPITLGFALAHGARSKPHRDAAGN